MKNLAKGFITLTVLTTLVYAMPTAKEKFNNADRDNDGVLTSNEFYNDQARKMEQKVSERKQLKGVSTAPQFDMVDTNNNGKVTFKEYDKFHTKRQKEMVSIRNKGQGYGNGR